MISRYPCPAEHLSATVRGSVRAAPPRAQPRSRPRRSRAGRDKTRLCPRRQPPVYPTAGADDWVRASANPADRASADPTAASRWRLLASGRLKNSGVFLGSDMPAKACCCRPSRFFAQASRQDGPGRTACSSPLHNARGTRERPASCWPLPPQASGACRLSLVRIPPLTAQDTRQGIHTRRASTRSPVLRTKIDPSLNIRRIVRYRIKEINPAGSRACGARCHRFLKGKD